MFLNSIAQDTNISELQIRLESIILFDKISCYKPFDTKIRTEKDSKALVNSICCPLQNINHILHLDTIGRIVSRKYTIHFIEY
jgi:hypothetical protein